MEEIENNIDYREIKKRDELLIEVEKLNKKLNITIYSMNYIINDLDVDDNLEIPLEN